jgi:hypothetical protein
LQLVRPDITQSCIWLPNAALASRGHVLAAIPAERGTVVALRPSAAVDLGQEIACARMEGE